MKLFSKFGSNKAATTATTLTTTNTTTTSTTSASTTNENNDNNDSPLGYTNQDLYELNALIATTLNPNVRKLLLTYAKHIKNHLEFGTGKLPLFGVSPTKTKTDANDDDTDNDNDMNGLGGTENDENAESDFWTKFGLDEKAWMERVSKVRDVLPHVDVDVIHVLLNEKNALVDTVLDHLLSRDVSKDERLNRLVQQYKVQQREKKLQKTPPTTDNNNNSGIGGVGVVVDSLGLLLDLGYLKRRQEQVPHRLKKLCDASQQLEKQLVEQMRTRHKLESQINLLSSSSSQPSPLTASSSSSSSTTNNGGANGGSEDYETMVLQKKLDHERRLIEKKMKEDKMQRSTRFFCKGEVQALQNKKMVRYALTKTNVFDCDAEQIHFRIAESQFQRQGTTTLYGNAGSYRITNVEYIVNPELVAKFNQCKIDLAQKHGFLVESMKPLLLFHGTSETNMESIIKTNFLLEKVGSTTDMGWYGKGFYFSEYPGTSIAYSRGNPYLLICLVLIGKAHRMAQVQTGCAKVEGYDSHVSPDGSAEVIIFNPDQVLPCYKVKYEMSTGY